VEIRRGFELPPTTFNRPVPLVRHRLAPARELARPDRRRGAPASKGNFSDGAEGPQDAPDAADLDHARALIARRALHALVALAEISGGYLSGLEDGRGPAVSRILAALGDAYGLAVKAKNAAREETGVPHSVEFAARTRAGSGDPQNARCEACGIWLGLQGGEIQHRDATDVDDSKDPVNRSAANAALLCGNAALGTGDRGLAERRDPEMYAMGFWLRNGQDPRLEPIVLHGRGSDGITVWLSEDGRYLFEAPRPQGGGRMAGMTAGGRRYPLQHG